MSEHVADSGARIVDRGYQHYGGARLGQPHATRVMVGAALRRGLGLRRSLRAKILPLLLILLSFGPTIFILIFKVLVPGSLTAVLPTYAAIYRMVQLLYLLFAGLIVPDLLCSDRRERVLSLYFAAPITRAIYLAAQVVGVILLMLLLTFLPIFVLFVGNTLLAKSAPTYLGDHWGDLWHLTLSGLVFAAFYGVVAMAVSSFTDRRAYASGIYLGLMLVSSVVANILLRTLRFSGHEWVALVDLINLPDHIVRPLFGESIFPDLNPWTCAGVLLGAIVVSLALVIWRYLGAGD